MNMRFILDCIHAQNYRITRHARIVMAERRISMQTAEQALEFGEIIEREPHATPYPSCLVLAWLPSGDPLHIKCSRSSHPPNLRIVTVYEPDDEQWQLDYKTRKKRRR